MLTETASGVAQTRSQVLKQGPQPRTGFVQKLHSVASDSSTDGFIVSIETAARPLKYCNRCCFKGEEGHASCSASAFQAFQLKRTTHYRIAHPSVLGR
jgi:hypothetical protein